MYRTFTATENIIHKDMHLTEKQYLHLYNGIYIQLFIKVKYLFRLWYPCVVRRSVKIVVEYIQLLKVLYLLHTRVSCSLLLFRLHIFNYLKTLFINKSEQYILIFFLYCFRIMTYCMFEFIVVYPLTIVARKYFNW